MLAIQQAAVSIMNPDIGGETIAGTLEVFESNFQSLPEGPDKERLEMIRALDALWNMNFSILTPNARNLLSVLAMLSPGMSKSGLIYQNLIFKQIQPRLTYSYLRTRLVIVMLSLKSHILIYY
jgi:hypothetical protein